MRQKAFGFSHHCLSHRWISAIVYDGHKEHKEHGADKVKHVNIDVVWILVDAGRSGSCDLVHKVGVVGNDKLVEESGVPCLIKIYKAKRGYLMPLDRHSD
jgi:hypothetical protein